MKNVPRTTRWWAWTSTRKRLRSRSHIVEFSIQSNHLHLIIEADDNEALARGMKSFAVRANRLFNAASGHV